LKIPVNEIVKPNHVIKVVGEGMPHVKEEGFGDLEIHFEIEFPNSLTPQQKTLIQSAFK
jgi:DnaJ-class molecular chaperone